MVDKIKANRRKIGLFSCILFGLGVMFPIAPAGVWGAIMPLSQGHMGLCYLLAVIPMTFTAWSFGCMGAAFPRAGSSYTFVGSGIHPYAGFITGWGILLDYILFPLMNYIMLAIYTQQLFPSWNYNVIIVVSILFVCGINLLGVKSIASVNNIITLFGFVAMLWFIFSAFGAAGSGVGMGITSKGLVNPETFDFGLILAGTSIACFSFLGFDTITTLAEDVKIPEKNLPRSTILSCLIMAAIFVSSSFIGQCVYPDYNSYADPDSAFVDVAFAAGGNSLVTFVSIALVACTFAFSLDMIAGATRVLYGMGRDGVLPKKIFGYANAKGVPVWNVLLVTAVCLIFSNMSLGDLIPIINFGGLFAFILVNLSVIVYFFYKKGRRSGIGNILKYLLMPACGFVIVTLLWFNLSGLAKVVGFCWLALGVIYLAVWSKGFKKPIIGFTSESAEEIETEDAEAAE